MAPITCCTVARARRNSRAIATGFKPASEAARIRPSCPAVTDAAPPTVASFALAGLAESRLSLFSPDADDQRERPRPGRWTSSVTAFASRALALGKGLPIIGKLLGHTQLQTTAPYAHLARDTVKASAARIGDSIDGDLEAVE